MICFGVYDDMGCQIEYIVNGRLRCWMFSQGARCQIYFETKPPFMTFRRNSNENGKMLIDFEEEFTENVSVNCRSD